MTRSMITRAFASAWTCRARSMITPAIAGGGLRLRIPSRTPENRACGCCQRQRWGPLRSLNPDSLRHPARISALRRGSRGHCVGVLERDSSAKPSARWPRVLFARDQVTAWDLSCALRVRADGSAASSLTSTPSSVPKNMPEAPKSAWGGGPALPPTLAAGMFFRRASGMHAVESSARTCRARSMINARVRTARLDCRRDPRSGSAVRRGRFPSRCGSECRLSSVRR